MVDRPLLPFPAPSDPDTTAIEPWGVLKTSGTSRWWTYYIAAAVTTVRLRRRREQKEAGR